MGTSFVLTGAVFGVRVGFLFDISVWFGCWLTVYAGSYTVFCLVSQTYVTLRSCDGYGIGVKLLILLLGSC